MGKPVVCFINPLYSNQIQDLPILNANPNSLIDVIRHILSDWNNVKEKSLKGIQFVEKYHNVNTEIDRFQSLILEN